PARGRGQPLSSIPKRATLRGSPALLFRSVAVVLYHQKESCGACCLSSRFSVSVLVFGFSPYVLRVSMPLAERVVRYSCFAVWLCGWSGAVRCGEGGRAPQSRRAVAAGRGQRVAVGGEGQVRDARRMALQRLHQPPGRRVPEVDGPVLASGRQRLPVRGEGDAADGARMGVERLALAPRADLPDGDRAVLASHGQGLAVGSKGQGADPIAEAAQRRSGFLAGSHVPDSDRFVAAAGDKQGSIARKGQAEDQTGMALQDSDLLLLFPIPERDRARNTGVVPEAARDRQCLAIGRESGGRDHLKVPLQHRPFTQL